MITHATISDMMIKTKNDSVMVADFGDFGSLTKFDISEFAKNKKLTVEEILEIINSMKSAVESHELNSLISDLSSTK